MGRVRRYKKVKSVENWESRPSTSDKHDQPPSIWEGEQRRSAKRVNKAFDDDKTFERMLQHEARRQIKVEEEKGASSTSGIGTARVKSIEGKKEDETMKEFKNRIRQETSKTLREEIGKLKASSKKSKQYLVDKKNKKKGKVTVDVDKEEYDEGFSARDDGVLRASDLGGADDWEKSDRVMFGERVDRPPEFLKVAPLKLKGDGPMKVAKHAPGKHNRNNSAGTMEESNHSNKKPKKEKKRNIADVVESTTDEGFNGGDADAVFFKSGKTGVGGAKASAAELEALREKVQNAYRAIRDKKRKF
jgi:hypothetical protein